MNQFDQRMVKISDVLNRGENTCQWQIKLFGNDKLTLYEQD